MPRDALEGKGPQRRPQKRLDRRLEEVAKAVGGGHRCLQMPLRLALGVRGTVAERRLGAQEVVKQRILSYHMTPVTQAIRSSLFQVQC